MPKYFTIDEANALIPRLTEILTELISLRPRYVERQQILRRITDGVKHNGHALPPTDLAIVQAEARRIGQRINELIEQVQAIGARVKDLQIGLIDFPSRRDEREILLCWRLGEDAVRFYHDPDSGYAGRRPLENDEGDKTWI